MSTGPFSVIMTIDRGSYHSQICFIVSIPVITPNGKSFLKGYKLCLKPYFDIKVAQRQLWSDVSSDISNRV